MSLSRVIYTSRPFGFDQNMLNSILVTARANNARDDITGALICRADLFIQYLEGPDAAVRACLARIRRDDRHLEVVEQVQGPVAARLFGDWAMLDDPAQSLVWSRDEVRNGAVEAGTPEEIVAMFEALRSRVGRPVVQ